MDWNTLSIPRTSDTLNDQSLIMTLYYSYFPMETLVRSLTDPLSFVYDVHFTSQPPLWR
jgi:hypothetical protein